MTIAESYALHEERGWLDDSRLGVQNFGKISREGADELALEQYEQYDTHRRALESADNVDELTADMKKLKH